MTNIYFDASVFSCPKHSGVSVEECERFLENIVSMAELIHANWAGLYISEKTVELLFETRSYPMWNDLKQLSLIAEFSIQARDISIIVTGLLKRLIPLETLVNIKDLLIDSFNCEPSYHYENRPIQFIEHFEYLLSLICFAVEIMEWDERNQFVLTQGIKKHDHQVSVRSKIVDYDGLNNSDNLPLPIEFERNFFACSNFRDFSLFFNPEYIWQEAGCVADHWKAIEIYLIQGNYGYETSELFRRIELSSFGSQFMNTARDLV